MPLSPVPRRGSPAWCVRAARDRKVLALRALRRWSAAVRTHVARTLGRIPGDHTPEWPMTGRDVGPAWTGVSCVLLGSGPAARAFDPAAAFAAGVPIVALNGAYQLCRDVGVRPVATVFSNPFALKEHGAAAHNASEALWVSSASRAVVGGFGDAWVFDQWADPGLNAPDVFGWSFGRPFYQSGTVAHPALQILVALGCTRILCVGIDLNLTASPHFYDSSAGERDRAIQAFTPNRPRMIAGLESAQKTLAVHRPDVRVVRLASPVSSNPFPPMDWEQFLSMCSEDGALGVSL